jgi:F-type H+-transporting ATPase subunit delta
MEGMFGVKANHVPVISQLRPGLVELHAGGEVEKYFISGGWAYVHPNGVTDIQALEAVTLDQVDGPAVKSALAAAQAAQAGDDLEAAVNRTAIELYSALDAAIEQKA